MKIAVLFGGLSEERDVSIASAAQIIPALRALGHAVFAVDTATGRLLASDEQKLLTAGVAPEPPSSTAIESIRDHALAFAPGALDIRSADVVFLALHGGAGEDGRMQSMLDLAGRADGGLDHGADGCRGGGGPRSGLAGGGQAEQARFHRRPDGRAPGEIFVSGEVFDYLSKYQQGGAREVLPADLPAAAAGIGFSELLDRICRGAVRRR